MHKERHVLRELMVMATMAEHVNSIADMSPTSIPGFETIAAELEEEHSDQNELIE